MPDPRIILPILAALIAVGLLSLMNAIMKDAALAAGAYSAAVFRSAIAAGLIIPVWLGTNGRWPEWSVLKIHILRGTVSAFMALSFFYALTKLPIAEAIAVSFIAPLIALYLAALLLGEQIHPKAIIGSILGFTGALIIISSRFGASDYDDGTAQALVALLFSSLLYAWGFIIIRKQALVSSPVEATTFHSGTACLVLLLAAPWFLTMPALPVMTNIAAASVLTVSGSFALTWAYTRAQAQVLVPMEYSGFLWAGVFGWLFFKETITHNTLAGTAVIVIGCLIAARPRPNQTGSSRH